ncbi:MAG: P-loop NTPase fold protein [Pseudonocardiaceae bacterium]
MATDDRWDRLTLSAKAAWRWAWATATARSGAAEPSSVLVDTVDLLAGLAVAHLRDNPVSQLCTHFHIPLGALLGDGGARRYRAEAMLAAARRIPDSTMPPIDEQAEQVLDYALSAMPPSSDGLVTLSMLFGALLETNNPASMALRTELDNRGVDVEPVVRSCREHLGTRDSYADYLRDHHPYQRPEIPLTPYTPDEPRTRRPPKKPDDEPPDLVDIAAEVNAFAYLIASRTLIPPLAIGLFGDWGSGKSYFLRSVQRRIDQLAEMDQPPFYRKVAQIEFNAWQYVGGNLWASLLEHLLRNLRRAGELDEDNLLDERRREYLKQITEATAEHDRAVKERARLTEEKEQAQQTAQQKNEERKRKLAELETVRRRNPLRSLRLSDALGKTLEEVEKRTGLDELGKQTYELQQTLASTGETLRRAGPVLGPLRTGGWRFVLAVVFLMVVIGLGPLISFILSRFDFSAVSNVIASLSGLLAGTTAYTAYGNKVLTSTLGTISKAQNQLNEELDRQRDELDEQIRTAEDKLADTERELADAVAEEQRLTASVTELEAELSRITPSSVLSEFLDQRFASDDYRRHLGVPALVRRDLERLSRLIQARHDGSPAAIDDAHAIDRIVLYIDDLDRCPTDMVIKVLEAVHLLLAFPLFVVVVAVDARWLESSLREHYSQLGTDQAKPADYLEKIFQVPFWVRPLGVDTRRRMVRRLLEPNLAGPAPATGAGEGPATETDLSDADLPEFTERVESFSVTDRAELPQLQAAKLTVTGPELSLIEDMSALIGATPRAVKRFINVYLLLKSVGLSRGWPVPEQGQVVVLLAIATGLPDLASELLPSLITAQPPTLRTLLASHADSDFAKHQQLARLNAWLADHPSWHDITLAGMDRWIDLILRFRFDRVPAPASPTADTPQ